MVFSGVTVLLCGMAIAVLGSVCHSPTVMLANFVATPIELRYFCIFWIMTSMLNLLIVEAEKFPPLDCIAYMILLSLF